MMNSGITRLLVVDDNVLICDAMSKLIEKCGKSLRVCASATNRRDALHFIQTLKPDVSLVDISLGGNESGLDLMCEIRQEFPEHPILAVSLHDEELYAETALRSGANGYLAKAEVGNEIIKALLRISEGQFYVSGKSGSAIVERYMNDKSQDTRHKSPGTY